MINPEVHTGKETVVAVNGLYKSFGENEVLKGVDLEVRRGENVIVLGRSGSGKSVLIRIIAGLMSPDAGSVTVLGNNVHGLNKKDLANLRLKIGFLFQNGALYDSLTVRENLEFSLTRHVKHLSRKDIDEAVNNALEAVGLPDTADQFPARLSGGQQKRIGIARMLILKPEVVLYDEPTAGLDPITSGEINSMIVRLKERYKTSSILITHDLVCARQTGDRLLMMVDGQFVRQGRFDEVFSANDENTKAFYDYNFIT